MQRGFSDEAGVHAWGPRIGEGEQKVSEKSALAISWLPPAVIRSFYTQTDLIHVPSWILLFPLDLSDSSSGLCLL